MFRLLPPPDSLSIQIYLNPGNTSAQKIHISEVPLNALPTWAVLAGVETWAIL